MPRSSAPSTSAPATGSAFPPAMAPGMGLTSSSPGGSTLASRAALIVHQIEGPGSYDFAELVPESVHWRTVLKIDNGTNNRIVDSSHHGKISFNGFGVAVIATEAREARGCGITKDAN